MRIFLVWCSFRCERHNTTGIVYVCWLFSSVFGLLFCAFHIYNAFFFFRFGLQSEWKRGKKETIWIWHSDMSFVCPNQQLLALKHIRAYLLLSIQFRTFLWCIIHTQKWMQGTFVARWYIGELWITYKWKYQKDRNREIDRETERESRKSDKRRQEKKMNLSLPGRIAEIL